MFFGVGVEGLVDELVGGVVFFAGDVFEGDFGVGEQNFLGVGDEGFEVGFFNAPASGDLVNEEEGV